MDDLISRQAAIDALNKMKIYRPLDSDRYVISDCLNKIVSLPSAQPEHIQNNAVHLCDSCQYTYVTCPSHGNDAVFGDGKGNYNICACNKYQYRPIPAQPEQIARDIATIIENERDMRVILKNAEHTETHESRREWYMKGYRDAQNAALHESCTDCPLYDHDRHNCPRFNKVIPTAIRDAQQPRWIPVTEALPEEDGEYLVTKRSIGWNCEEYNSVDIAYYDDRFHKANKIVAWMPLPPSYKGEEDE